MRIIEFQNIASSKITVTNTATLLFDLMNTAGATDSKKFFTVRSQPANGIEITPEDGDIRVSFGLTPTSLLGKLLSKGTKYYIPLVDLTQMKLIRVSGNVLCSIDLYFSELTDSPYAVAEAVTLEASDIHIGDVQLLNDSGVQINPATEDTLAKLVGFAATDDLTITDTTLGDEETITLTNGVITKTIVINNVTKGITINWT